MNADAVVIGAGLNGLVAAAVLGRAGRRVVLIERRARPGGRAVREEFHAGFHAPGPLADTARISDRVLRACGQSLARSAPEPVAAALGTQAPFLLHRDPEQAAGTLGARHPGTPARYRAWRTFLDRVRPALRRLLEEPAPELAAPARAFAWSALGAALGMRRRVAVPDLRELLRGLPSSLEDWLEDWLPDEGLRTALAVPSLAGQQHGPRAPGTAALLIMQEALYRGPLVGGAEVLVGGLIRTCQQAGVNLVTGSAVTRLRVERDGVRAVELADGALIEARQILITCEPRRALRSWLPPRYLPAELDRALGREPRGALAFLDLAVSSLDWVPPPLEPLVAARPEAMVLADDLGELEFAQDACQAGMRSTRAPLEVRIPSLEDPTLAPSGQHVVRVLAHAVSPCGATGWSPALRAHLTSQVHARLAEVFPTLGVNVVAERLLTPADLEEHLGLTGGHLHQGDPGLGQMLGLRPAAACAQYATPISGLFLGGDGCHPGGLGPTGLPGLLAAERMLSAARARAASR